MDTTATEWLTIPEAAALVRVGRRTIDKHIREGRLRALKVNGRDIRIARQWLDECMERLAEPTAVT